MTKTDSSEWDEMKWRRRLETFGDNDAPSTYFLNLMKASSSLLSSCSYFLQSFQAVPKMKQTQFAIPVN